MITYICLFFFLAALVLHCFMWALSSCGEWGLLCVVMHRLLTAVASFVGEHVLLGTWAQELQRVGSRAGGLSQAQ